MIVMAAIIDGDDGVLISNAANLKHCALTDGNRETAFHVGHDTVIRPGLDDRSPDDGQALAVSDGSGYRFLLPVCRLRGLSPVSYDYCARRNNREFQIPVPKGFGENLLNGSTGQI